MRISGEEKRVCCPFFFYGHRVSSFLFLFSRNLIFFPPFFDFMIIFSLYADARLQLKGKRIENVCRRLNLYSQMRYSFFLGS